MSRTWRIGEVAERTGLTRRTLRHYDDLGLLVPSERSWADYRLYTEDDLLRLLQIQNLKALGLSLDEIAAALSDPSVDAAATLRGHLAHLEDQIAAQQRLAGRLRRLADSPERSWDDVLDTIAATRLQAHHDPVVRMRATLQGTDRSAAELVTALADETNPAVQEVLLWALSQEPDAAEVAIGRLTDPNPELRGQLARLLGKLREPAHVRALVGLLDDPVPRVATAAVIALGQLARPDAAPALAARLGSGRIPETELLEALAAHGSAALEPVLDVLATGSESARTAAAEVLGRIGEPGAVAGLTAALDGTPPVRLAALLALAELGAPGRPGIRSVVDDPRLGTVARRLLDLHVT